MSEARVLFVAWDGPDQAYLESLFLPIFGPLAQRGFRFHVMQFRFGPPGPVAASRAAAARWNVPYTHVPVPTRFKALAAPGLIALGAALLRRYVREQRVDLVMPRSILPAAMGLCASLPTPILFDADGLASDERVDFAGWSPTGLQYRIYRDIEAQAVRRARAVVTRTRSAREVLIDRAGPGTRAESIHVVPNAIDERVFRPDLQQGAAVRAELGLDADAPLVVYVGSLGPQYLPEAMLRFFASVRARAPRAHLVVLTGHEALARATARDAALPPTAVSIRRVPASEVPRWLAAADLGLALRQPTFSQRAVSPIKVGEYLLTGVPVLATSGVGDLDNQLGAADVGRLLPAWDDRALAAAADWFLTRVLLDRDGYRRRCRARGEEVFGMTQGLDRYEAALRMAVEPRPSVGSTALADRTSMAVSEAEPS